jgi:microcystin-dependent protein
MGMVMMICADNLRGRMFVFGRGMFAGHRVGGMQGARVGAVVRQCVAMSRHSRAARTVRRAATAQPCARATSAHMSAAAATTMSAATATATAATAMSTATAAGAATTTTSAGA